MLLLKKIDVYGQICLIAILLMYKWTVQNFVFFNIYYAVGLWQSISALMHYIFRNELPLLNQRKNYQLISSTTIIALVIALLHKYNILGWLLIILLVSTVLAGWYFYISCKELENWASKIQNHNS